MQISSIFDKLKLVFDLVIDSKIFVIFIIMLVATLILRLTNLINNKKFGFGIYAIELLVFGIIFFLEKNKMIGITNNLVDNIFINFYFPSIYVYLFIIVFSSFIFMFTLLNKKINKTYKVVTNVYFYILNFIFILFVDVILKNDIDIFAKESLFTNNICLSLLELSTLLFFIYLVFVTLVCITNYLISLVESKKTVIVEDNNIGKLNLEISAEEKDKVIENNSLEQPVSFNQLVDKLNLIETNKDNKNIVMEVLENNIDNKVELFSKSSLGYKFIDPLLFEEDIIIENEDVVKPQIIFENKNNNVSENITLKDYKLFSKMLKTVIINSSNSYLTISEILNKNLLSEYSKEEYKKFEKILNSCLD